MNTYEVWIDGSEHRTTLLAQTAGKAKYAIYLEARDAFPDLKITQMR